MKYSVIIIGLAAVASAVAAPHKKGSQGKGNKKAVGAAFFISNEPKGNQVIVSNIASDGTLSLNTAVSTGGKGGHGKTDPIGPDALFSQGAVKALGNMLFAVNPGSNTISMFNINMKSKKVLTMVGKPVDSGGEFPMSIAVSKAVNMVCALNGGAKNGVACFTPDPKTGLKPVANTVRSLNVNQTTPPAGPAGTMSHAIFSLDGKQLIAAVKGNPGPPAVPGFLATWDIAADGSLSQDFSKATPGQGGLLPFGMTAIPGTSAILSTDAAAGIQVFNGANSTSTVTPIGGQVATCWSAHSEKTGNFYVTDIGTATVTEVNVDQNLKASIVAQYPQGNGSATIDDEVATVGNKDFLYVMAANATSIAVNSLDAPGKATKVQMFNFGKAAKKEGIKVNPFNVQGMTVFMDSAAAAGSSKAGSQAKDAPAIAA